MEPSVSGTERWRRPYFTGIALCVAATLIIPVNFVLWLLFFQRGQGNEVFEAKVIAFLSLAALQLILGIAGLIFVGVGFFRKEQRSGWFTAGWVGLSIWAGLVGLGGPVGVVLAVFGTILDGLGRILVGLGSFHGRRLRLPGNDEGKTPLAEGQSAWLREVAWVVGPDLSPTERELLHRRWLDDARAEHASVAAFARLSWMLSAVGAPPELHLETQRAAMDEVEHTRLCLGVASAYGSRAHTVASMPELAEGMQLDRDVSEQLLVESIEDGCLGEGFAASLLERRARAASGTELRALLARLAADERRHTELAWRTVAFLLGTRQGSYEAARRALEALRSRPCPRAFEPDSRQLARRCDPNRLRAQGVLPQDEWKELWRAEIQRTQARLTQVLHAKSLAA